jgi:lipase
VADVDAELDEHLIALPNGRMGWRINIPAMMSYWSELTRPFALPRHGTPTTLVRATRTDPPYVSEELVSALDAHLGSDFTLVEFDCDHMVAQAKPVDTAAVIRRHAG